MYTVTWFKKNTCWNRCCKEPVHCGPHKLCQDLTTWSLHPVLLFWFTLTTNYHGSGMIVWIGNLYSHTHTYKLTVQFLSKKKNMFSFEFIKHHSLGVIHGFVYFVKLKLIMHSHLWHICVCVLFVWKFWLCWSSFKTFEWCCLNRPEEKSKVSRDVGLTGLIL